MKKETNKISTSSITVAVLAYNEEMHIADTIEHIIEGNKDIDFSLKVYANGCTDNTIQIAKELEKKYPNLQTIELKIAGKPNAWNSAFYENHSDIIMFCDADILLEPGTIKSLAQSLKQNSDAKAATAQYTPLENGLSFEKKLTGFMQLPIEQEYITGHFYAIRRKAFIEIFQKHNIKGIPEGLVGEDLFVDLLVNRNEIIVSEKKCFYEPPTLEEYAKYFARMRWQNQQMKETFEKLDIDCQDCFNKKSTIKLLKEKWKISQNKTVYLIRCISAVLRHGFLFFYKNKINKYYKELGPVTIKGDHILRQTRSLSTK